MPYCKKYYLNTAFSYIISRNERLELMKKIFSIILVMTMTLALFSNIIVLANNPSVSVEAPSQLTLGNDFTVVYKISNAVKLYTYEMKVSYSNNLIFKEGKNLMTDAVLTVPKNQTGYLTFASSKAGNTQGSDGDFNLAELTFTAVGSGTAVLSLDTVTLTDDSVRSVVTNEMTTVYSPRIVSTININTTTGTSTGNYSGSTHKPSSSKTPAPTPTTTPTATPQTASVFNDIGGYDWAKDAIHQLEAEGIIKGTGENTFSPEKNIKRADYILLMVRMLNLTADVSDNFLDVEKDSYYYQALGTAKSLGILTGTGENQFEPEKPISRQDIFTLAYRMLKLKNKISINPNYTVLDGFNDASAISDYARESISILVQLELIKGNSNLSNPKDVATRAETAVFIQRLKKLF